MEDSPLLYRVDHRKKIEEMAKNLREITNLLQNLPAPAGVSVQTDKVELIRKIEELQKVLNQRLQRVSSPTCRIAVMGLEKQGKSTFVNAWIKQNVLPADSQRCTWAASTIVNDQKYGARVTFLTQQKFETMVDGLYEDCHISRSEVPFPLRDNDINSDKFTHLRESSSFKDLKALSKNYNEIRQHLDGREDKFDAENVQELNDKLYGYIALKTKDGHDNGSSYAVERAQIHIPLKDKIAFAIDDLPGINAPGNRAEKMTWQSVENEADVIVFVKSASANASLDGSEEKVWDRASRSDSSIKLTERIFVVLNQADRQNVHHGRDCHRCAAENFMNRNVPARRIFYCSSAAELFEIFGEDHLDFKFSKDEYVQAKARVGVYRNEPDNPTTGFPEFRQELYSFISTDLRVIEERALQDLTRRHRSVLDDVSRMMDVYDDDSQSESQMVQEEIKRFDELWSPTDAIHQDKDGLRDRIAKVVNTSAKEYFDNAELRQEILESIRADIQACRKAFVSEHITVEKFREEYGTAAGTSLRNINHMRQNFYNRIQRTLKECVYSDLGIRTAKNLYNELEKRWKEALAATTPQSKHGFLAVPEEDLKVTLLKNAPIMPDSIFKEFVISYCRNDTENNFFSTKYGFDALLKSVVYTPSEYLISTDESLKVDADRLVFKAGIFHKGISSFEHGQALAMHFDPKDGINSQTMGKLLRDDPDLLRKTIAFFLPPTYDQSDKPADVSTPTQPFGGPAKSPFGAKPKTPVQEKSEPTPKEVVSRLTEEDIVNEVKKQVETFFDIIESMLFDDDFGFIGYYLAQLERFRIDLLNQSDSYLKELARRYRDLIWPDEPIFRSSYSKKERLERVMKIRALLR